MKQFSQLFKALDSTTSTNAKVRALKEYFGEASQEDVLWTIALFTHKRPKRTVSTTLLRQWAAEAANIPLWLFEDAYHVAGDLAETIALVIPPAERSSQKSLTDWVNQVKAQSDKTEIEKRGFIIDAWQQLDFASRFLFNKLITGGFRLGVSKKLITKALSQHLGQDEAEVAHRLMGDWNPDSSTYNDLLLNEDFDKLQSRPYPFYLAYALEGQPEALGNPQDWIAEYKWDGIRGQIIKRGGDVFVWSRGEDLINDSFPEFQIIKDNQYDDFVIDGEIIVMRDGKVGSFQELQSRLGRKKVSKKKLQETPAMMIVYDILEWQGEDVRHLPQSERRIILEEFMALGSSILSLSESIAFENWESLKAVRHDARKIDAEGLMLKAKIAPYQIGRKTGGWWKWKLEPYTVDAVMIYAQRGHGRRANLYTDYTFAVWDTDGQLVPFAKAYSGLTDAEFKEVTRFVTANTMERFGPVRSVKAELVFEIAFEGISKSKRHKSGIALRFPRIHRWRRDKRPEEANMLKDLEELLK